MSVELLLLAAFVPRLNLATQTHILIIIFALFLTHIAEIGFYAMAYAWAIHDLGLGSLEGLVTHDPMEFLYFSSVIYTSLGLGDVYVEDQQFSIVAFVSWLGTRKNAIEHVAWMERSGIRGSPAITSRIALRPIRTAHLIDAVFP